MNQSKRLEQRFSQLQKAGRGGLVTFITAGDPDIETSTKILNGLPAAGADIIELGMPFSDPMADGPAIQLANIRALDNGATLKKTLKMVSQFRQQDQDTPIILMGYFNPIYHYGVQQFLDHAQQVGVDGLIIVDLPPEEDEELCHPCLVSGIHWIRLTTPTSDNVRLQKILKNSSGFVYHVSIAGITGTGSATQASIKTAVSDIRKQTDLPIAVGFGIKTATQVQEVCAIADAAVVGSALVSIIADGTQQNLTADEIANNVHTFVAQLAQGVKGDIS